MEREIKRENYSVILEEPSVYVDNEARGRSGHMSHGLAEFAPGKLIDFNSNCSAKYYDGHSTFGWIEYRISEDGGETFSDIYELPYSKECFIDGLNVISVEKAVACDDGRIVAVCLRNYAHDLCQPWDTPMVVCSNDGGKSWEPPVEVCKYKGRVYDACYYNSTIYLLEFCNDGTGDFCGRTDEHVYRIFTSTDGGRSFDELCVVPMPTYDRGYGTMLIDDLGRLHVYAYNQSCEEEMDHVVSDDLGKTWHEATTCHLAKCIRNPQIAQIDGVYVLHGRGHECDGFLVYTSLDGQNFDEGEYITKKKGLCYYSNNIVLKDKNNNNRLLIQYSDTYYKDCVNVMHMWLRIKR